MKSARVVKNETGEHVVEVTLDFVEVCLAAEALRRHLDTITPPELPEPPPVAGEPELPELPEVGA